MNYYTKNILKGIMVIAILLILLALIYGIFLLIKSNFLLSLKIVGIILGLIVFFFILKKILDFLAWLGKTVS